MLMLTQLSSRRSSGLVGVLSLLRGGSNTVGGGTSRELMMPTSSIAFPTSVIKSSIEPFGRGGSAVPDSASEQVGDAGDIMLDGGKAPSRLWSGFMASSGELCVELFEVM